MLQCTVTHKDANPLCCDRIMVSVIETIIYLDNQGTDIVENGDGNGICDTDAPQLIENSPSQDDDDNEITNDDRDQDKHVICETGALI